MLHVFSRCGAPSLSYQVAAAYLNYYTVFIILVQQTGRNAQRVRHLWIT